MLSRVADAICWMSRYIERAENIARFVDVNLHMMLDLPVGVAQQWEPLVNTTGDQEWFAEHYGGATQEKVIKFLTFDKEYPNSILSCLRAARENARSVREIISSDMWEQVNRFYLMVNNAMRTNQHLDSPHEFFAAVKLASETFGGVTDSTMSHGEGWHFYRLGRLLERADKTSRILDVKYYILLPNMQAVGSPLDNLQWAAVLHSASAFEMYRKTHGSIRPEKIIEFLVLDRYFPRAIQFCLNKSADSLHAISGTPASTFSNPAERHLGQIRSELAYADVQQIIDGGVHEFLDALQHQINQVGEGIYETFFAHRPMEARASATV